MSISTIPTATKTTHAAPPTLVHQTALQVWEDVGAVSFTLPVNTFSDPAGQALHYTATLSTGQPLPNGLIFNTMTGAISGKAPISPEMLGIKVTATNTSGLSTSETFAVDVVGSAPILAHQTGNMNWTPGHAMSFLLPANTFSDRHTAPMTYKAMEIVGTDQTSWLHFNATTGLLSGMVPAHAAGFIGITIVATNADHMTVSDTFGIAFGTSVVPTQPIRGTESISIHPATI